MQLFMEYDWPGNIREFENLIKRAVVLGSDAQISRDIAHLVAMSHRDTVHGRTGRADRAGLHDAPVTPALAAASGADGVGAKRCSLKAISKTAAREAERELILQMLQHTCWNRKETAQLLGISYKALLYKIKENGLDKGLRTS
jgi:DNA-binding NtrC family response regulator